MAVEGLHDGYTLKCLRVEEPQTRLVTVYGGNYNGSFWQHVVFTQTEQVACGKQQDHASQTRKKRKLCVSTHRTFAVFTFIIYFLITLSEVETKSQALKKIKSQHRNTQRPSVLHMRMGEAVLREVIEE